MQPPYTECEFCRYLFFSSRILSLDLCQRTYDAEAYVTLVSLVSDGGSVSD